MRSLPPPWGREKAPRKKMKSHWLTTTRRYIIFIFTWWPKNPPVALCSKDYVNIFPLPLLLADHPIFFFFQVLPPRTLIPTLSREKSTLPSVFLRRTKSDVHFSAEIFALWSTPSTLLLPSSSFFGLRPATTAGSPQRWKKRSFHFSRNNLSRLRPWVWNLQVHGRLALASCALPSRYRRENPSVTASAFSRSHIVHIKIYQRLHQRVVGIPSIDYRHAMRTWEE